MRSFFIKISLIATIYCSSMPTSNGQISQRSLDGRVSPARPAPAARLGRGGPPAAATSSEIETQNCPYFYDMKFPKTKPGDLTANALAKLNACVSALNDNIPIPGTDLAAAITTLKTHYSISTPDEVNEELITTHYLSRVLRRWANLDKDAASNALTILDSLDGRLHAMMNYVGLLDPLAGSLVAGPVLGETGKLAQGTTSTSTGGGTSTSTTGTAATSSNSQTTALAHIEWGSKHFGEDTWSPIDLSFGGSIGVQPALTLLTNPPPAGSSGSATAASSSTPATTAQYQSAFLWDLNVRANYHTGSAAETSGFFRGGQVRLLTGNGATVVDQGANSTLQIPLNSGADQMAWFWETGAEFNYYSKSLEIVHAEKGQFDPAFNIGISYKIDTRFKQSTGVVGFDSPDRRLVFRFMVNGIKIFDRRPDTTASKPYALSFGVEHEQGFGSRPLPGGTQIIIRGDINLLKLINPGKQ